MDILGVILEVLGAVTSVLPKSEDENKEENSGREWDPNGGPGGGWSVDPKESNSWG